jgi:hypothetical protein
MDFKSHNGKVDFLKDNLEEPINRKKAKMQRRK